MLLSWLALLQIGWGLRVGRSVPTLPTRLKDEYIVNNRLSMSHTPHVQSLDKWDDGLRNDEMARRGGKS